MQHLFSGHDAEKSPVTFGEMRSSLINLRLLELTWALVTLWLIRMAAAIHNPVINSNDSPVIESPL